MEACAERIDGARFDEDTCGVVFEVAVRAAAFGGDDGEAARQRLEDGDAELLLCACARVDAGRADRAVKAVARDREQMRDVLVRSAPRRTRPARAAGWREATS